MKIFLLNFFEGVMTRCSVIFLTLCMSLFFNAVLFISIFTVDVISLEGSFFGGEMKNFEEWWFLISFYFCWKISWFCWVLKVFYLIFEGWFLIIEFVNLGDFVMRFWILIRSFDDLRSFRNDWSVSEWQK